MNLIENLAGELCKILLPINAEVFFGNPKSSVAICTLANIKLLREIADTSLMSKIAIVGRLLSENKGIDSLVRYVISHKNIQTILICGSDTYGHSSGHSLLCLYKNGIDEEAKIIGSSSPDPKVSLTELEVSKFQKQVKLIDEIGETNISKIKLLIEKLIKN